MHISFPGQEEGEHPNPQEHKGHIHLLTALRPSVTALGLNTDILRCPLRFLSGSPEMSTVLPHPGTGLTAWVAQLAACSYSVGWYLQLDGTR